MHAIRCGVAVDDSLATDPLVWNVLSAGKNSAESDEKFLSAFHSEKTLHIFSSFTAIVHFSKRMTELKPALAPIAKDNILLTCGVGQSTDAAAQALAAQFPSWTWQTIPLAVKAERGNGLQWTLEQLSQSGFIPAIEVHLWTKTHSTSEDILEMFRRTHVWPEWRTTVHEIYELNINRRAVPQPVVSLLNGGEPVCFGTKSAEALDALLQLLFVHFRLQETKMLPAHIHFSVWEKSATLRAQELGLQERLIPFAQFESLMARGSSPE
jgi:hypothetical protein